MFVAALATDPRTPLPDGRQIAERLEDTFPGGHRMLQPTLVDPATGLTLSAWLRLDNPEELAAELGDDPRSLVVATAQGDVDSVRSSPRPTEGQSSATKAVFPVYDDKSPDARFARDAALVLTAYRKWGPDCVGHFEGDFSFVILDPRDGSMYAARDAVGVRPLYIAVNDELFAASPSAEVFDLFPGVDISVRWEWLADYIHGMSGDWRETPFVGVKRLPPGHWLRVTRDEVIERRYHEFDSYSPWEDTRDPRWLEAYRTELIRAVSVRTEPEGLIGVESSGGLDSSAILGVLAHTHPERIPEIHTFGFVRSENEPQYILETSAAHGITHNHIFVGTEPKVIDPQRAWRSIGYPSEHSNALGYMPFYALAERLGVCSLHSGHGGDEVVSNFGTLALKEAFERGSWRRLWQDLPGSPLRKAVRLARLGARRPADTSRFTASMVARLQSTVLHDDVVAERDLLRRIQTRAKYDAPFGQVNDFVLNDRLSVMTTIRTAESSLVAATFGVDYRWALLDRRLIAQFLRTPAVWKYGDGYGRYLHRCSLRGMVPDAVIWKVHKNMGRQLTSPLRQVPALWEVYRREYRGSNPLEAHAYLAQLDPQVAGLIDSRKLQRALIDSVAWSPVTRQLSAIQNLSGWLDGEGPSR